LSSTTPLALYNKNDTSQDSPTKLRTFYSDSKYNSNPSPRIGLDLSNSNRIVTGPVSPQKDGISPALIQHAQNQVFFSDGLAPLPDFATSNLKRSRMIRTTREGSLNIME